MGETIEYRVNHASAAEVERHLQQCSASFVPPLAERVSIDRYAQKIAELAERFEAWGGTELAGLVAAYFNGAAGQGAGDRRVAFVTSVSVLPAWQGRGVAATLMTQCIEHARRAGLAGVDLEVDARNAAALGLYQRLGFVQKGGAGTSVTMQLDLARNRA